MNDSERDIGLEAVSVNAGPHASPTGQTLSTAGQLLRRARATSGLSLEQVSARVKVSVPRLMALEEDRFEDWPDANVVRAVAASVCRQLGTDPAAVLERMPKAAQKALVPPSAEAAVDFRDRSVFNLRGSAGSARLFRGALGVAVGVALALLLWVFGSALRSEWDRLNAPMGLADLMHPAEPRTAEPVLPPDAAPTDTRSTAAVERDDGLTPVASSTSAAAPVPEVKGMVTSASEAAQAPIEKLRAPTVAFKASGSTWVEVSDAKGSLLLRRTLVAGETAAASGDLPLSVVVGRVDHTDVLVWGEALRLQASPTSNVARFTVP